MVKKYLFLFLSFSFLFGLNAEDFNAVSESDLSEDVVDISVESDLDEEINEGDFSLDLSRTVFPERKNPRKPDPEKIQEAAKRDESDKTEGEYRNTIKYGIASEISDLVDKLISNEDPRFVDEIYDLFQTTRSTEVKEKILNYFKKLEDPCLEDFAVKIIDDPFDEKKSTVQACFQYIQAVKTKEAVIPVLRLIENENEDYFNDALSTIGYIGGPDEAVKLTEYIDKDDFTDAQKQALMRTLGKIHAVETWDKLVETCENPDENLFVRMYAAEAIGAMEKLESVPVLVKLFEETDPNLRQYVLKGLEFFPDVLEAKSVILEAVRDDHYKVRLEAIEAVKKQEMKEAVPYLVYRAENDPENKVKLTCYEVIAYLNTKEGNDFLIERITEKKANDTFKAKAAEVLLKEKHAGDQEIKELALKIAIDDKRKVLRAALGKHIAKYPRDIFDEVCTKYLESKDATTQSQGLEMYQNGKYKSCEATLQLIADDKKANASNRKRARRLLGLEEE